jgi:4-carboxymuconolactone decarboxylase
MSRVSSVERDALPEDQRRFYDAVKALRRRPISGPFIVTMNSSPDLAARFAHLGHYFHARGQADESILPLRVRAFIALIGSRALDGVYEWSAWHNWAIEAGVSQATADAIREGRSPDFTPEEALVNTIFTELLSGHHRLTEATTKAAFDQFGIQGLVELVGTLGYFAQIAFPLNAFEMEMSPEQLKSRKPFAPLVAGKGTGTDPEFARRSVPPLMRSGKAMPRVRPLSTHDDVAPEHQHFLDRIVRTRGWLSGLFQVLLHSPDMAERIAHVGDFFLYETIVSQPVKALTGLIAARELDSDYVWNASLALARAAEVDARLMDAIEKGGSISSASPEQKRVLDFCYQLLRGNHHVTDGTYRDVVDHFGVPAAVQISGLLGYFVMMALIANAFEVAPDGDISRPAL